MAYPRPSRLYLPVPGAQHVSRTPALALIRPERRLVAIHAPAGDGTPLRA